MRRTVILNNNANNTSIETYNNRILESAPNNTYLNKSQEEMHAINLNRNIQHNEQHDLHILKGSKCHVYGSSRPDNVFICAGDGDWTYDNLRMTGFTNSNTRSTNIETAPDSNSLNKSQAEMQAINQNINIQHNNQHKIHMHIKKGRIYQISGLNLPDNLIIRAGENDRNIDEEVRQLVATTSSSDEITMLYDNRSYNPDPRVPEYSKMHSEPDTDPKPSKQDEHDSMDSSKVDRDVPVMENRSKPTIVTDIREQLNREERVKDGVDCRRIFDPG